MVNNSQDMLATSKDYQAMLPYWKKVAAFVEGADTVKKAGELYLPKLPNETPVNYQYRLNNARFTNIYRDIGENLASKPFSKEVKLDEMNPSEALKGIVEDIDGSGTHLNVFSNNVFFEGINSGITWVMVDYPSVPANATLADERKLGVRPYWVQIDAKDLLWVESAIIDGHEQIVYAKIHEPRTARNEDGTEKTVDRVRILVRDQTTEGYAPARFEVWEKDTDWKLVEDGSISIGVIPLVPFYTGRRRGATWQIIPPMSGVADAQIEHYQEETKYKIARELCAFPMLVAKGIDAPTTDEKGNQIVTPVGPGIVLYAPPYDAGGGTISHGDWGIIEPQTSSLKLLSDEIDKLEAKMRELGRQPLTSSSTGLTQVAAAFASQKAASTVQAWAYILKDALENCFALTSKWLDIGEEPSVFVNSDFAIEIGEDKQPDILFSMQKEGILSRATFWQEMMRRNILSSNFAPEKEEEKLEAELPDDSEDDFNAAMTPDKGDSSNDVVDGKQAAFANPAGRT